VFEEMARGKVPNSKQLIIERQLQPRFAAPARFAIFKCERSAVRFRDLPA
jgi:hypothetical protein